jgi:hypothetical protein
VVKKPNNLPYRTILILLAVALVLSLLTVGLESFFSEKYSNKTTCSEFGTQEKAQHAYNESIKGDLVLFRLTALDSDNDGRACEANPKSAPMIMLTFIGLFGALMFVEFKKVVSLKDTNFFRKFLLPSLILAYPVNFSVSQLRDRILPSATQTYLIYLLAFVVAFVPTIIAENSSN